MGTTSLRVCLLGSGSGGNALFVATGRVRLLIDAGFSFRSIGKRLAAIGEDPARLDGVVVTHEHGDHTNGLFTLIKKTRLPVYITRQTAESIDWRETEPVFEHFQAGQTLSFGDLEIDSFTVPHDALDPVGFCLRANGVKIGCITDLGYLPASVKLRMQDCDMLFLESNHDAEMLKVGPYPWFVKQRVMSRVGHLSNQMVADFLSSEFDRRCKTLVLTHLSENNNHPEIARMFAAEALQRAGAADTRLLVAGQHEPTEVFEF